MVRNQLTPQILDSITCERRKVRWPKIQAQIKRHHSPGEGGFNTREWNNIIRILNRYHKRQTVKKVPEKEIILVQTLITAKRASVYVDHMIDRMKETGLIIKGDLKQSIKFKQLLEKIKARLEAENFRWAADSTIFGPDKEVNTISVVWGSANSLKDKILASDSEVVIVGEIGYHNTCDIIGSGKAVIEMGHGSSEKWAIKDMYNRLMDYFRQEQIDISLRKSKKGYMCWRYNIG